MRFSGRKNNELRDIEIVPNYIDHSDGSCLFSFGKTKVLCTATIENKVPFFLKNSGQGWITAEYALLPGSTHTRTDRESVKGKQNGRTHEIQRLIGRALRASLDLYALNEKQIKIDCDVLQADGGTRTASICGACVALGLAIKKIKLKQNPLKHLVAAVSCGIVNGNIMLDLDYLEDSGAVIDANFVFIESGEIAEVQASAEKNIFTEAQLFDMLQYARDGVNLIFEKQKEVLLK